MRGQDDIGDRGISSVGRPGPGGILRGAAGLQDLSRQSRLPLPQGRKIHRPAQAGDAHPRRRRVQPRPKSQMVTAKTGPKAVPPKTEGWPPEAMQQERSTRRSARPSHQRGGLAQSVRPYRYDSQPELRTSWPPRSGSQPRGGPVYETGRRPTPLLSQGCDEICQYRAWFRQYNAWYQAYGRRYPAYPDAPQMTGDRIGSQSERDRLDPWHGYNSDDGPQNGY